MKIGRADEIDAFARGFEEAHDVAAFPALAWYRRSKERMFWYERAAMCGLDEQRSEALFLRNWALGGIEHRIDVPAFVQRIARTLRGGRGAPPLRPGDALDLVRAATEAWACEIYRRDANPYYANRLPAPFCGWREAEDSALLGAARSAAGQRGGRRTHWSRAAFLMRGAVAGMLGPEHLPSDIPWHGDGMILLRASIDARSLDELFAALSEALPALYGRRRRPFAELAGTQEEVNGAFLGSDGDPLLKPDPDVVVVPSWNAIRHEVKDLVQPLRETVRMRMERNDPTDRIRGMRHGRFDRRALMRAARGDDHVFSVRETAGDVSCGVMLLVDVSSSMTIENPAIAPRARAFGGIVETTHLQSARRDYARAQVQGQMDWQETYAQRLIRNDPGMTIGAGWHLAFDVAVALSEAFAGLDGVDLGITAFSDRNQPVKRLGRGFGEEEKGALMHAFVEAGDDTLVRDSLLYAQDELRRSGCASRLAIVLTDGAIASARRETPLKSFQKAIDAGMDLIVLGIANDAGKGNVPAGRFWPIWNEDDVVKAIGPALDRLLKRNVA